MNPNQNKTVPMRLPGGGQVAVVKETEIPTYLRMGWVRFDGKDSNAAPVVQQADPELEDFAAQQEARRLAEASGVPVTQVQQEQVSEGEEPPARKRKQ